MRLISRISFSGEGCSNKGLLNWVRFELAWWKEVLERLWRGLKGDGKWLREKVWREKEMEKEWTLWRVTLQELQGEFAKEPKMFKSKCSNLIRINLISLKGSLSFWISCRFTEHVDSHRLVGTSYQALIAIDLVSPKLIRWHLLFEWLHWLQYLNSGQ